MTITRRSFLELVVASAALGCSGEMGSTAPVVAPKSPTPPGGGPGTPTGAAGVSGQASAQRLSISGAAGANAVEARVISSGGTGSVVLAESQPTVQAAPQMANIRGRVSTKPALAAKQAVVYLANAPIERVVDVKIDDQKLNFFPQVAIMTVGGTMTYVNRHPFPDSAFSGSNNDKWDFGMVEAYGTRKRKFDKPGQYTLLCHIHPNQVGFLIVSPSSYFAQADKDGNYVIPNVPSGNYELVAWAPRMKLESRVITIASGEATADFELKR